MTTRTEIPVEDLVGRPFVELADCAELVAIVLERVGIELSEAARSGVDLEGAVEAIRAEGFEELDDQAELEVGDLVLFLVDGWELPKAHPHVGVIVAPGRFVHATKASGVRVDSIGRTYWKRRLTSRWRRLGRVLDG